MVTIPKAGARIGVNILTLPKLDALPIVRKIQPLPLTLGSSITLLIFSHGEHGWLLYPIALSLLVICGVVSVYKRDSPFSIPLLPVILGSFLILSMWASVYGSTVWGSSRWGPMAILALWMSPFLLIPIISPKVERILPYLIPGATIHMLILYYQGFQGEYRPDGLVNNPNPAAGLLVVVSAYLLTTKWRVLAIPMMASAMLYTGSRWAVVVIGLMLGLMLLKKVVSWRFLAVTSLLVLMFAAVNQETIIPALRLQPLQNPTIGEKARIITRAEADVNTRLGMVRLPHILPKGDVGEGLGPPHNVPLRIGVEAGILAMLAWVILSLRPLVTTKPSHWTGVEWSLIALLLLGLMDHYVWVGALGVLWWLMVSNNREAEHNAKP